MNGIIVTAAVIAFLLGTAVGAAELEWGQGSWVGKILDRAWGRSVRRSELRKAEAKGFEQGRAEAIASLVETDDNAAIVEAIGGNLLELTYLDYGAQKTGWEWKDASLKRASLRAIGDTPRAAYLSYKSQRTAAAAICEQLDEVERVRKETSEDAA